MATFASLLASLYFIKQLLFPSISIKRIYEIIMGVFIVLFGIAMIYLFVVGFGKNPNATLFSTIVYIALTFFFLHMGKICLLGISKPILH